MRALCNLKHEAVHLPDYTSFHIKRDFVFLRRHQATSYRLCRLDYAVGANLEDLRRLDTHDQLKKALEGIFSSQNFRCVGQQPLPLPCDGVHDSPTLISPLPCFLALPGVLAGPEICRGGFATSAVVVR